MDWQRVTTILIVAFAALNGFLLYHLRFNPVVEPPQPAYLTAASAEQVAEALEPYRLTVTLPDVWPARLPDLRVEPLAWPYDPLELFDGEPERSETEQGTWYQQGRARVFLTARGHIFYSADPEAEAAAQGRRPDPDAAQQAQAQVLTFLARFGGEPAAAMRARAQFDGETGQYRLRYEQRIEQPLPEPLPFFDGYVDVRAVPDRVVRYEWQWWHVVGTLGDARPVMPLSTLLVRHLAPGGALRNALGEPGAREELDAEQEISAELGYTALYLPADDAYRAQPAWRISVPDLGILLFDASDGKPLN